MRAIDLCEVILTAAGGGGLRCEKEELMCREERSIINNVTGCVGEATRSSALQRRVKALAGDIPG